MNKRNRTRSAQFADVVVVVVVLLSIVAESAQDDHTFKIDFATLFDTLCKIVTIDQATLLLYLLLHRNPRFYRYAMEQENLQQLVIPILQTLYNAPDSTSHHIYMTLIVLLILSEDDGFNKSVHQIVSICPPRVPGQLSAF